MTGQTQKPDRREYTFMVIPHHGKNISKFKVPIKVIKYSAVFLGVVLLVVSGTFINLRLTAQQAVSEQAELEKLRKVNSTQAIEIEQLAQATAVLQQDMNRLNNLDAELRRIVNQENSADASRSGAIRQGQPNDGQGGPVQQPSLSQLKDIVGQMQTAIAVREQSLQDLRDALVDKNARLAVTPSIIPADGDITSRFGWRSSPWGWGSSDWHPGIDIANDSGTPIVATAKGVVVESGWNGGYGYMVKIDHGNGIETVYGHNSENIARVGQSVNKGDLIAYMGNTGYSTGPHVHYEVRVNGNAVNPANFI